jgi:hypothetical protein
MSTTKCQLLAALPADDYARILPDITVIPLILKETLHKPGSRIDYVYFPGDNGDLLPDVRDRLSPRNRSPCGAV